MQDHSIIDFSFTLSQLSGNEELATKMLERFRDDYLDVADKVKQLIDGEENDEARQLVHTLKGVTGNLGIQALHQVSKSLEHALKVNEPHAPILEEFDETVELTLKEAQRIINKDSEDSAAPAEQQDGTHTECELISMLNRNEFIPPDKLSFLLTNLQVDNTVQQALQNAIEDLDYPLALSLLEKA